MCDDKLTCYEPEAKGHLLPLGSISFTTNLTGVKLDSPNYESRVIARETF